MEKGKSMFNRKALLSLVALLTLGASISVAENKVNLDGVKCLLQPTKPAAEGKSADWKKGKVYFCCNNCSGAFEKDKEKYAAKANAQLVSTKQYKQQACPISGAKLDDSTAIEVAGAKVAFCCNNCKGKVEAAKGDEQLDLAFGEKAFEKGKFELVKEEKK